MAGISDTLDETITLVPVYLNKNTRALSIYSVSINPNKREFLLPPGTVLMKTEGNIFVVIGVQK